MTGGLKSLIGSAMEMVVRRWKLPREIYNFFSYLSVSYPATCATLLE
jgi:hypothetical protein